MRTTVLFVLIAAFPLAAVARDTTPPAMLAEPGHLGDDGVVTVEAQIVDESGVFDPILYWRVNGTKAFEVAKMAGDKEDFRATFVPPPTATGVEYYIEAYDSEGNGPARFGAPSLPVRMDLAAARRAAAAAQAPPPVARPATPATRATPSTRAAQAATEVPAAAAPAAGAEPVPREEKHEVDARPAMPAWRFWGAVGSGAAGVVLAVAGAAWLSSARGDAAAYNDRVAREGSFSEQQSSSITNTQRGAVALVVLGVASAGVGAVLYTVDF